MSLSSGMRPAACGTAEQNDQEQKHFDDVVFAFTEYELHLSHELVRRERHLLQLPEDHLKRLPGGREGMQCKLEAQRRAMAINQEQLLHVVGPHLAQNRHVQQQQNHKRLDRSTENANRAALLPATRSATRHHSKVASTLHQLAREWSAEGAVERQECFSPVLAELQRWMPADPARPNALRVLAPGVGLGRLAAEICGMGYACQGNEFDYFMLLTSSFVLNQLRRPEEMDVYPWLDVPCNVRRAEDVARAVLIPDVPAGDILSRHNPNADLSMCAGEFIEVYGGQRSEWDAVVTCFFLDTAPNVVEYVRCIWNILKPGGVWVNHGPLLWHWYAAASSAVAGGSPPLGPDADARYKESVEMSYDEVRAVVESFGFEIRSESWQKCRYTCNVRSMMHTTYETVLFTAVKPALQAPAATDTPANASGP